MQNTFSVNYKGQEIMIEQLPADQYSNIYYIAHMPGENLKIEYTEDDEGAGHWLDEKTNNATPVSIEIGELIELYRMQNKVTV